MKIAVINSIYRPESRGGTEVVVENIVQELKKRGFQPVVITLGRQAEVESESGVKIYRIKPFNIFNFLDLAGRPAWLRFFWHLFDIFNDVQTWRVFKILLKEKPAAVFSHNLKGLGYSLPWLFRAMKLKQVQTVHDCQLIHPSGLLPERLSRPAEIYALICRKLFGSPEVVVFPSEFLKLIYERRGFFSDSQKIVLANPVSPVQPEYFSRASFSRPVKLLFLGQLEEYKGILDFLKIIVEFDYDFLLEVVGDGGVFARAKELAGRDRRIVFRGRLKAEELNKEIWPQIDLLVNPSQASESFGLVVIEAYAHGVPVLVSDRGALPELVRPGRTGWSAPLKDWPLILRQILAEPIKLKALRENCLREARQYRLDEYLNSLLEFAKIRENS